MKTKKLFIDARLSEGWIGGLYYRKNIVFSLLENPLFCSQFDIIILANSYSAPVFDCFCDNPKISVLVLSSKKLFDYVAICRITRGGGFVFPVSGSGVWKFVSNDIEFINWIPDFQELRYPEYFSAEDLNIRKRNNQKIAYSNNLLVLSSNDALNTFIDTYPNHKCEVVVCPFASYLEQEIRSLEPKDNSQILEHYELKDVPYFCVSNQFWIHKNHEVVLKALIELKFKGLFPKVVFTGQIKDYRQEDYIVNIKRLMEPFQDSGQLVITGFLARDEQIEILNNAKAIIQPSLFEGWGTVLEDCKVLDKRVILSDIPVHREQMNENCLLFDPESPRALGDLMIEELSLSYSSSLSDGLERMRKDAQSYSSEFASWLLRHMN